MSKVLKPARFLSLVAAFVLALTLGLGTAFADPAEGEQSGGQDATPPAVTAPAVAKVGETEYVTLAEAVAAANSAEGAATVVLLQDVTLGEALTISGDVIIEGEYTITRDDAYTGILFTVGAGASLTLDGNLTIDGGNNWSFDQAAYDADLKAFNKVTNGAKYFTPEEGAPVASGYMITTSGTVNLNEVTIKNHYSSKESGIVSASTGATVNLTGAKITHNASTSGSGLVVNASSGKWDTTPVLWVNMNEGTVIDGNHVGGNHGIFKVYMGTVFTMNGGVIKNTTGWNSNGVAVGVYWATFDMNGGEICSNSSVYGPNNGRNAAIYGHSAHIITIDGGSICHNVGGSRSGLDAPYADSTSNGVTTITGGFIGNNSSYYHDNGVEGYDPNITAGDKLTVAGGSFTKDVTEWLAPNSGLSYDEATGVYTVVDDIAEVNGTTYGSVEDAIIAAKKGDTVKVLASHKVTESIDVPAGKMVTLDLNGKTVQTDPNTNDQTAVHLINNLGNLTIIDSAGEGALIASDCATDENGVKTKNGFAVSSTEGSALIVDGVKIKGTNWGYALYVVDAKTSVVIKEGSVIEGRGGLYLDGGATGIINGGSLVMDVETANNQDNVIYVGGTSELTINGGSFDGSQVPGDQRCALAALDSSKVTINGGSFDSRTGDIQVKGTATVTVTGGSFMGDRVIDHRKNSSLVLTGGTYAQNPDPENKFCAEGFAPVQNSDGTYTVMAKPENTVASVNGVRYATLEAAFAACSNGETVVLEADITYGDNDVKSAHGGGTGFGKYDSANPSIIYFGGTKGATASQNMPSAVNAVLDLNGHTIINNADAYLILAMDNSKLTIKDSKATGSMVNTKEAPVLWAVGVDTVLTIDSGKFATASSEGLLWSTHGADVVVNGGTFSTSASDSSLLFVRNAKDLNNPNYFVDGEATITVKGGTFYGFNPEKMYDDSTDPYTEFNAVAEGYVSSANAEGTIWTVSKEQTPGAVDNNSSSSNEKSESNEKADVLAKTGDNSLMVFAGFSLLALIAAGGAFVALRKVLK